VPQASNSNDTERFGRITNGCRLGRTALVQRALIEKGYSPYLKAALRAGQGAVRDRQGDHFGAEFFRTSYWRRREVRRTEFFMPRKQRAVRYAAASAPCPCAPKTDQ